MMVAAAATADGDLPAAISKAELVARFPELKVEDIHAGPVPGLYEVDRGTSVYYVTTDGRFLFRGDIVDLGTRDNLTEARRAANRAALLAAVDPAKEIVFSPASGPVKHRVIVFTDVDCGYCRQFHRQIDEVTALGIEVHYLFYPRTGPNTESWAKAEKVWCAADRKAAMTLAKRGAEVAAPPCTNTPVAEGYELGQRIGITGTPGVYSETGVELGGYIEPQQLLAALEQLSPRKQP
jgi:thiol:disulfide interchange protein DsbC